MDNAAKRLYEAYCAKRFSTQGDWDSITDDDRAAWQAVADSTNKLTRKIGTSMRDPTHGNIIGTVESVSIGRLTSGYWLTCIDTTGRPFELFVDERDATPA